MQYTCNKHVLLHELLLKQLLGCTLFNIIWLIVIAIFCVAFCPSFWNNTTKSSQWVSYRSLPKSRKWMSNWGLQSTSRKQESGSMLQNVIQVHPTFLKVNSKLKIEPTDKNLPNRSLKICPLSVVSTSVLWVLLQHFTGPISSAAGVYITIIACIVALSPTNKMPFFLWHCSGSTVRHTHTNTLFAMTFTALAFTILHVLSTSLRTLHHNHQNHNHLFDSMFFEENGEEVRDHGCKCLVQGIRHKNHPVFGKSFNSYCS